MENYNENIKEFDVLMLRKRERCSSRNEKYILTNTTTEHRASTSLETRPGRENGAVT